MFVTTGTASWISPAGILKMQRVTPTRFRHFKLFQNGAVQVHTADGTNTAVDLYWGERQAVWQSGQAVLLTTPDGAAQDSYPVP